MKWDAKNGISLMFCWYCRLLFLSSTLPSHLTWFKMCDMISFKLTNITELLGTNSCFHKGHLYVYMSIKRDRMDCACCMHATILKFFSEHQKRRVFGRSAHEYNMILKLFLRKWSERLWQRFVWLSLFWPDLWKVGFFVNDCILLCASDL
jgi:hypothetical protein